MSNDEYMTLEELFKELDIRTDTGMRSLMKIAHQRSEVLKKTRINWTAGHWDLKPIEKRCLHEVGFGWSYSNQDPGQFLFLKKDKNQIAYVLGLSSEYNEDFLLDSTNQ
jgi:hypothetical protein